MDGLMAKKEMKKNDAILTVLRGYIKETKRVLFEGNGYGEAWVIEAKKRGLSNLRDTPSALHAYISDRTVKMMGDLGIFKTTRI